MQLVTPQTGPEGKKVNKVLIAQDVYYPGENEPSEFYMSVLLDRASGRNIIMYSPEGGMDIEEVADQTPDKLFKEEIDPTTGFQALQARGIALNFGFSEADLKEMVIFVSVLYKAYDDTDTSLFETKHI